MNDHEETVVPALNLGDLTVISPLGRGAKGVVFLVKEEQTGDLCALKVILRDLVEKKINNKKEIKSDHGDENKRVCFERRVLSQFNHPLLPRLRGVLATDKIVGYAIDFCPGRDLHELRKQQSERMFSVDMIKFYAVELVLVLEYLHNLGIVYRDLKPENILIQENGHIMLVDFDLSTKLPPKSHKKPSPISNTVPISHSSSHKPRRFLSFHHCCSSGISPDDSAEQDSTSIEQDETEKSNSFVGTEEYVAPEIIQGYGHDSAVDWWSLGIVMYEMLYGVTPFKGSNRKETFFRILTRSPDLVGESTPMRDLIGKLLIKDPKNRIKLEEIKSHDFFRGTCWDLVLQVARPPYIPPVSCEFWAKEGTDGIMKIDVESFVQRIFCGAGNGEKEKVDDDKKHHEVYQEENITDKGLWVKGLNNNHSLETDNFLVF